MTQQVVAVLLLLRRDLLLFCFDPTHARSIGINTGLLATRTADRLEARSGRPSRVLTAFMRLF